MPRTRFALALIALTIAAPRAHAVSKEMVQLQTQIQQLQDAVARLQQSNDERMGVLKDLVQQTADSVNRMSVTVNGLKLATQNQGDAFTAKTDAVSGQVQSLNDSLDEMKARFARIEKALADVQNQQAQANAILTSLSQPGTTTPAVTPPATTGTTPLPAPVIKPAASKPAPTAGPSAGELYRAAYGDYMTAKYPLAASEFDGLIKAYPDDNLSGNAYFYLGEIDTRTGKPTAAVKSYDQVLEHYPDNAKIPAAHLHKAEAMLSMKQTDAGIRELRALIQRFPNSPEASQAKTRLATLTKTR